MFKKIKEYIAHILGDNVPAYEKVTAAVMFAMGAVLSPLTIHLVCTVNWVALMVIGLVFIGVCTCDKWWPIVRPILLKIWKYLVEKQERYPCAEFVWGIAYDFLIGSINRIWPHIKSFQSLYYDEVPIAGSEAVVRYPRAKFGFDYYRGVPVYRIALFRMSRALLGTDVLRQDGAMLQSFLGRVIEDGDLSLGDHPICYVPNLPTLCLLDVTEQGDYTYFNFVWVNNEKAADVISRYGVPPVDDDTDDFDF